MSFQQKTDKTKMIKTSLRAVISFHNSANICCYDAPLTKKKWLNKRHFK